MKREVSNENGVRRNADAGEGEKNQSRDIALLVIAVFLVAVYFIKGFSITDSPLPAPVDHPQGQTIFEVEDPSNFSKVYTSPKDISLKDAMARAGEIPSRPPFSKGGMGGLKHADTVIKSGSKITIDKDSSAQIGQMSGEKHIIFSIPLDINKATAHDFEALPGIGPKLAEEIIATRKKLGGFKTIGDLKKVKGIGEKKFERIRGILTVNSATPSPPPSSSAAFQ